MNIVAITQARFSSSRLPGKVLKSLGGQSVLGLHLKRINQSKLINSVIVATTQEPESKEIEQIAISNGAQCFHGDLNDVLDRFYKAVESLKPDYIVRLTSDCPLIDPKLIDDLITQFLESKADYAANFLNPTLPDGMDAEIFTFKALEQAWREATKKSEREHVTPFIRESGKFTLYPVQYPVNWSHFRMTLDTAEDYELLSLLVDKCGENASLQEYVEFLEKHKEAFDMNSQYQRNEGYLKSLKND